MWSVAWPLSAVLITVVSMVALLPYGWAKLRSHRRIRDVSEVPTTEYALVLGAGVRRDGQPSPILRGRLDTANALWRAGKITHVLVSGSPSSRGFSEPVVMRDYLVRIGTPAELINLDESGVDTWRSCQHAANQVGLRSATVVTTRFHLRRAVALCRRAGIDAYGVGHDAAAAGLGHVAARGARREFFALMKAFWWRE